MKFKPLILVGLLGFLVRVAGQELSEKSDLSVRWDRCQNGTDDKIAVYAHIIIEDYNPKAIENARFVNVYIEGKGTRPASIASLSEIVEAKDSIDFRLAGDSSIRIEDGWVATLASNRLAIRHHNLMGVSLIKDKVVAGDRWSGIIRVRFAPPAILPLGPIEQHGEELRSYIRKDLGLSESFFTNPYLNDRDELLRKFPLGTNGPDLAQRFRGTAASGDIERVFDNGMKEVSLLYYRFQTAPGSRLAWFWLEFDTKGKLRNIEFGEGVSPK